LHLLLLVIILNLLGKTIPLRIYGEKWQPIDRDNNVFELQITPLAVY
jgi:hypothetical protein